MAAVLDHLLHDMVPEHISNQTLLFEDRFLFLILSARFDTLFLSFGRMLLVFDVQLQVTSVLFVLLEKVKLIRNYFLVESFFARVLGLYLKSFLNETRALLISTAERSKAR